MDKMRQESEDIQKKHEDKVSKVLDKLDKYGKEIAQYETELQNDPSNSIVKTKLDYAKMKLDEYTKKQQKLMNMIEEQLAYRRQVDDAEKNKKLNVSLAKRGAPQQESVDVSQSQMFNLHNIEESEIAKRSELQSQQNDSDEEERQKAQSVLRFMKQTQEK